MSSQRRLIRAIKCPIANAPRLATHVEEPVPTTRGEWNDEDIITETIRPSPWSRRTPPYHEPLLPDPYVHTSDEFDGSATQRYLGNDNAGIGRSGLAFDAPDLHDYDEGGDEEEWRGKGGVESHEAFGSLRGQDGGGEGSEGRPLFGFGEGVEGVDDTFSEYVKRRDEGGNGESKKTGGRHRLRSPGVRGVDMLLGKEVIDEEGEEEIEQIAGGERMEGRALRGESFSFE